MSITVIDPVRPWTLADVEALPDDGNRYEILTVGELTVSPAPQMLHQRAVANLLEILRPVARDVGLDVEVVSDINLLIHGERYARPDIALVDGGFADTNPLYFPAAGVVAVGEVVSPSTQSQDRRTKARLYADAGIGTYWRGELEPVPQVIVSTLRRGRYVQVVAATAGVTAAIEHPFPVKLDPAFLLRS